MPRAAASAVVTPLSPWRAPSCSRPAWRGFRSHDAEWRTAGYNCAELPRFGSRV